MSKPITLAVLLVAAVSSSIVAAHQVGKPTIGKQEDGAYIVSSNQRVAPFGVVQTVSGSRPKDSTLSPDGKTWAVLTQSGVLIYNSITGEEAANVPNGAGPLGIAWAPDGTTVFASQGNGKVTRITKESGAWGKRGEIGVDVPPGGTGRIGGENPQVAGLAVSADGTRLFVALGIRNAVVVVNLKGGSIVRVVPVETAPYQIVLSPDGKTLAVANRGGAAAKSGELAEDSAGTPVRVDKTTDAAQSGSITLINTDTFVATHIPAGRQPSGMAFSPNGNLLYAACSDSDTIVTINVADKTRVNERGFLTAGDPGFGRIPTDIAVSPDGRTLYVTLGGANCVAVMDAVTAQVKGRIPTGWFPIAINASDDWRLCVASAKGYGSQVRRANGGSNVHGTVGVTQFFAVADALKQLPALSAQVAANNRDGMTEQTMRKNVAAVPVPERVGEPSLFKHVVYIIKENMSYDNCLGDLKDATGKPLGNGDPNLCTWTEDVTPNHHALAREYVTMDNTFTSGTNSADGHQWSVSAVGNGYIEQNYAAHVRSYPYDGGDPLAYSPAGFLWTQAVKFGKTVRVYGEFVNNPVVKNRETGKGGSWTQIWQDYKTGGKGFDIHPETDLQALRPYLHPRYIGFPSVVSDQWRADQFIGDVDEWDKNGKMPDLSILLLPNDHTAGTNPAMPTPRATVADNDLALGRIVERLSKSKTWKDTLILVIEDDSQNGVDHVDGHRTPAFAISPYTRRGAIVSEMYNHTSFIRTMGLILGFDAMNRFDRTATPMAACFSSKADNTPYVARMNKIALDEMNPKPQTLRGEARRLVEASAKLDLSDVDRADAGIIARANWHAQKPGVAFPAHLYKPNGKDED